jgi:hypothetical protein
VNIEIHKPELVQRLTMRIGNGEFQDADELIERALDALDEHAAVAAPAIPTGAAEAQTGAVVLAALQESPYRDIDLTTPRVELANVRDVVL